MALSSYFYQNGSVIMEVNRILECSQIHFFLSICRTSPFPGITNMSVTYTHHHRCKYKIRVSTDINIKLESAHDEKVYDHDMKNIYRIEQQNSIRISNEMFSYFSRCQQICIGKCDIQMERWTHGQTPSLYPQNPLVGEGVPGFFCIIHMYYTEVVTEHGKEKYIFYIKLPSTI